MAVQKQDGLHTDVAKGREDLTGKEDRLCVRNSDGTLSVAGAGAAVAGVISEGMPADYYSSFNTLGNPILRVIAGSALTVGQECQSNGEGAAVAGSTNPIGKCRKAVGGSGEIVEIETYSAT